MLILPGHPDFNRTLGMPPPAPRGQSFVVRAGSLILEPVSSDLALTEYLEGGEYDQRLVESGQDDLLHWDDEDEYESDILFLPQSLKVT